jgi:superfamily II DNA or RNA helicase/HKD family nuclease
MIQGIYEELITKLVRNKIAELNKSEFYINEAPLDPEEAALLLGRHLGATIQYALGSIKGINQIESQIQVANKIIQLLISELHNIELTEDIIESKGLILKAVFSKINSDYSDLDARVHQITPSSRLIHSDIFTGGRDNSISLDSELRKEILSSDRIDFLVSFIKWRAVNFLQSELKEFVTRGGKLRVISTTYMGATDPEAIELLSAFPNTEVKISYNTGNERLHAKAYMFYRNTGFHTAYIGSSNFSRSALTDGLEWNIKITTKEVGHLIAKFQKTFESYWLSSEFETFDPLKHSTKLIGAINEGKTSKGLLRFVSFFDLKPYPFQSELLEKLSTERLTHGRYRNLVVAATGTGKTIISAFDYKNYTTTKTNARLLFVAHKKEILEQALQTFQAVLKDGNFGELWVDGQTPGRLNHVFASVQTLKNVTLSDKFTSDYFDYIIIDEVHHIPAASYRPIISYFHPEILLGLTATPERSDNADILIDFCNRIAAEIRLPEALNRRLLCPFQYFGLTDSVDLSKVKWSRGKYDVDTLTQIYTSSDQRISEIISSLNKYVRNINDVRALCFCASVTHARFMCKKFIEAGLFAGVLTGEDTKNRDIIKSQVKSKEINYLFTVDIFNEGVDIPEIDTILFLRPTESLTIFLQQLGRGLRLSEGKDCLTVLDFVGNARPEYNFENKFRALIGKTSTSVKKEIENNFPHLPLGCSITLEKKAQQHILRNITDSISPTRAQLLSKIRNFEFQSNLTLTLRNFLNTYDLPIEAIYKRGSWNRLCFEAGKISSYDPTNEATIVAGIANKWLSTRSTSYFVFIRKLARYKFNVSSLSLNDEEKQMMLMLHYDFWSISGQSSSLEASINRLGSNAVLVEEMIEVLEYLIDQVDFIEIDPSLKFNQPLKLHGRYTRDQILAAFGLHKLAKAYPSYGVGVVENKDLNIELLFIDLEKSEEDYSPTTRYNDYIIDKHNIHWQTQNATRIDSGKGLTYLQHKERGKTILLFIREMRKNEHGNTIGYVFIGPADFQKSEGSKPVNIQWRVSEPIPPYFIKDIG